MSEIAKNRDDWRSLLSRFVRELVSLPISLYQSLKERFRQREASVKHKADGGQTMEHDNQLKPPDGDAASRITAQTQSAEALPPEMMARYGEFLDHLPQEQRDSLLEKLLEDRASLLRTTSGESKGEEKTPPGPEIKIKPPPAEFKDVLPKPVEGTLPQKE